jgi:CO/xanthine dehydrogenase Mo-binding subunit
MAGRSFLSTECPSTARSNGTQNAGEGATIPPPATIANAIFDAVGVRLREGPFTPKRVLAGLKKT